MTAARFLLLLAGLALTASGHAASRLLPLPEAASSLPPGVHRDSKKVFLAEPSRRVTFPAAAGEIFCEAGLNLPEGTQYAGCWVLAEKAPVKLDFVFADAAGRETVVPTVGEMDQAWAFRGVTPPEGATVLRGVRVVHPKGVGGTLWLGDWMADDAAPGAHRDFIWQLKSLEFSKRFTFFRTARQFIWSGFDEAPFLPVGRVVDDPAAWFLLPEEGPYRAFGLPVSPAPHAGAPLEIEVTTALNTGQPIDTRTYSVAAYDPAANRLDRIPLPLGKPGSYLISASVRQDGAYLGARQFALDIFRNEDAKAHPHAPALAPAQLVCTQTIDDGDPVFAEGQPVVLGWKGLAAADAPVALSYQVFDYTLTPGATGEQAVTADATGSWTADVALPGLAPGAYYLRLTARQAGRTLGEAWQLFGIRAAQDPAADLPNAAPATFDELFGPQGGVAMQMNVMPLDHLVGQETGPTIRRNQRAGTTPVLCFYWADLEPLPGVYQFAEIDRRLDAVARAGLKAFISPWVIGDALPQWAWYEACLNQRGTTQFSAMRGSTYVSPSSRLYRDNQLRFIRAFVRHFRGNPTVLGYYFPHNGAEGFYPFFGEPELVPDYSEAGRRAFQAHLRDDRRYSLAAINKRYGLALTSWDELECPLPDFARELDDRPQWRDFMDFHQAEVNRWVTKVIDTARAEDPVRPLLQYGLWGFGSIEEFLPVFRDRHVALGNGGSDTAVATFLMGLAKNDGIVAISESTHTPPFEAALNLSSFNNLATGRFKANDLCWNHLAHRYRDDPAIDRLLDYYRAWPERLIPALRDTTVAGRHGAVLVSPRSLILHTRFFSALAWARDEDFSALMEGARQARWMPLWTTEQTPDWSRFPVIWDTGIAAVDDATREKLLAYAAEGGALLTSFKTGALPEQPGGQPFAFFRSLGLEPAQERPLNGVKATLLADSPYGARGASVTLSRCWPLARVPREAEVLANDLMGRPVLVRLPWRHGTITVAAGELDLHDPALFAALKTSLNGEPAVDVSNGDVWSAHVVDGAASYVALLSRPPNLRAHMNPRGLGSATSQGTWSLATVDNRRRYTVRDLVAGGPGREVPGSELRAGLPFALPPGGLAVYKITAAEPPAASQPAPTPTP